MSFGCMLPSDHHFNDVTFSGWPESKRHRPQKTSFLRDIYN